VKLFRACEEGNVRRAYDLGQTTVSGCDVHITSLQPSRPLHALVAAPGSKIDHPAQLIGEAVAVNFFAGSHFAAIRLLEGFVGRENVKLLHFGGPGERLAAVLRGEVAAGIIMEPYVTLAEKLGQISSRRPFSSRPMWRAMISIPRTLRRSTRTRPSRGLPQRGYF